MTRAAAGGRRAGRRRGARRCASRSRRSRRGTLLDGARDRDRRAAGPGLVHALRDDGDDRRAAATPARCCGGWQLQVDRRHRS
ncbi:MAG: hypothetical protein MZW92_57565 [Comamonadaceae bacterium]|nr:hypothetical protein [Comamonadaceae bacterium]